MSYAKHFCVSLMYTGNFLLYVGSFLCSTLTINKKTKCVACKIFYAMYKPGFQEAVLQKLGKN